MNSDRKIVFAHGRAPGDCLMLSAGIRDFKALFPEIALNVECKFPELFTLNPAIDTTVHRGDPGVEFYRVGYPTIQGCNEGYIHFSMSFLLNMISVVDAHKSLGMSIGEFCSTFAAGRTGDKEETGSSSSESMSSGDEPEYIPPGRKFKEWRARWKNVTKNGFRKFGPVFLSEEEKSSNPIKDFFGVERYWIVAPGGKRDCTCKIWDWRRFQTVVDHYEGLIKFVVIGRSDHLIDSIRGTINYVDKTKTNLRDLFPLFYHAEGVVSGVSFPMHLAASIPNKESYPARKPCVAIYGGREPVGFTGYEGHQILHTIGALPCCPIGGCWQSRVSPLAKDADKNNRLCHAPVQIDGRPVQKCMDMITADDVIRAIGRYYEGGRYSVAGKLPEIRTEPRASLRVNGPRPGREINLLASLRSSGGGEQSACRIAAVLRSAGWTVHFHPWGAVDKRFSAEVLEGSLDSGAEFKPGIPLLFYGNDQIWDFCKGDMTRKTVENSTALIIGVNYANGSLPRSAWLNASGKVRGVIFQNSEKRDEFRRDAVGFTDARLIVLHGAIDMEPMYAITQKRRTGEEPLVVLKHCKPDFRKYVTEESVGNGDKIHVWQRRFQKERDVDFYERLLKEIKFPIQFWFMEAHKELVKRYEHDARFRFLKWDAMPVTEFLGSGHVYLYRTSNLWRDQYPRCMGEALAAGLPVLGEPRDGPMDRIRHGDTGFYCADYDMYLWALKALRRKEDLRYDMGFRAKEWAKVNLDPRLWIDAIEECLG